MCPRLSLSMCTILSLQVCVPYLVLVQPNFNSYYVNNDFATMCAILDLRVFFPKNHTSSCFRTKSRCSYFFRKSCGIKNGAAVTLAANMFRHCNTFDDYKESSSSEPTLAHAAQCCICENLRALRNIVFELKKRAYLYLNVVDVAFFSYFFQYV